MVAARRSSRPGARGLESCFSPSECGHLQPTPDRFAMRQARLCDFSILSSHKSAQQKDTGIIHGCFPSNQMNTYEERYENSHTTFGSYSRCAKIRGLLAAPYDELAAKGYRWVTTYGSYSGLLKTICDKSLNTAPMRR